MSQLVGELNPPVRLLCGTGPTNPDPRVLRAMGAPVLGQFDPAFTAIMTDVMELGRQVFRTRNPRTFAISGTGRAGMEAGIARSEEHTSELQSQSNLVCRLLLEKKKK